MSAPIVWDEQGMPHSVAFDDKYFCKDSGYEEAIYVACQGNHLRERFSGLDPDVRGIFTIIETGFGTGLDFCCVWQLWDECAPKTWGLHFISVEFAPLSAEDMARALSLWACLSPYKEKLLQEYRSASGGIGEFSFEAGRVRLTLVFEHVIDALRIIRDRGFSPDGADALLLDGFAPSKNPEMWSDAVFAGVRALSRPGTTLSTFTVAGFVRRGLAAQGFEVTRITGHGVKKNVLTGVLV